MTKYNVPYEVFNFLNLNRSCNKPYLINNIKLESNIDTVLSSINLIEDLKKTLIASNVFNNCQMKIISDSIEMGVLTDEYIKNKSREFKLAFYNLIRLKLFERTNTIGNGVWTRTDTLRKIINYTKDNY